MPTGTSALPATTWRWPTLPTASTPTRSTPTTGTSVLARPDVKVGIADPRFDASGYRALMAFALAQDMYHQPTHLRRNVQRALSPPVTIFQDDDLTTITVPEIVETKPNTSLVIRGASIQLDRPARIWRPGLCL